MMLNGSSADGASLRPSPPSQAASDRVLEIVAECTRYPRECLELDVDFEDELGIDSVKRAEIAARLLEAFGLEATALEALNGARSLRALIALLETGSRISSP